jgi:hypothetical protein
VLPLSSNEFELPSLNGKDAGARVSGEKFDGGFPHTPAENWLNLWAMAYTGNSSDFPNAGEFGYWQRGELGYAT